MFCTDKSNLWYRHENKFLVDSGREAHVFNIMLERGTLNNTTIRKGIDSKLFFRYVMENNNIFESISEIIIKIIRFFEPFTRDLIMSNIYLFDII